MKLDTRTEFGIRFNFLSLLKLFFFGPNLQTVEKDKYYIKKEHSFLIDNKTYLSDICGVSGILSVLILSGNIHVRKRTWFG